MRGQEEAALVGLHATKIFDITKGQDVWYIHSSYSISYLIHVYAPEFHNYDWLCNLATFCIIHSLYTTKGGQVTKPIVDVKFQCINMNEVTDIVVNMHIPNLLAFSDIKDFCCMLLLLLASHFLHPRCF